MTPERDALADPPQCSVDLIRVRISWRIVDLPRPARAIGRERAEL
jgi:hypothetical protein